MDAPDDRREIADLLIRYATALDSREWELLATCFTPDAVADYEGIGEFAGLDAITGLTRSVLEHLDATQHMLTNMVIAVDGDRATARCYLHAQHTLAGTDGGDNYTIGGTYTDDLVRTDDGWRIRRRHLRTTWREGNPKVVGQ